MFCPNCGNEIEDGKIFCTKCGTKLDMNSFDIESSDQKEKKSYWAVGVALATILVILAVMCVGFSIVIKYKMETSESTETVASLMEKRKREKSAEITPEPTQVLPSETVIQPEQESEPVQAAESAIRQQVQRELDQTEFQDAQINSILSFGSQAEMNENSWKLYELWDDELNVIWGYLKQNLDTKSMNDLTQVQIDWIKNKEQAMNQAEAEWEEGSGAPFHRNIAGYEMTKIRVYELYDMLP